MSEPKRTGLLKLLRESQGCQFVIPVYQRNYTWKATEQVNQFLCDIERVLKGEYKNHFLGIIIYLEKSIDFSAREFSVIDGQQRLTTTFLMIYAIKQLLEKKGDTDNVKQLEGQFLTNPYSSTKLKYKLKPLVSDDDVYRCIVEKRIEEIDNTDSKVYKNYIFIKNKIEQWDEQGYDANQILLAMDKLYLVCVPISDEDNAQKIFESINATGVTLTAADLIRNYLLMNLTSDMQDDYYVRYWKKIEDYVSNESKELELFFRMYLSIKLFSLVSRNSVYREFMTYVEANHLSTKVLLEELLDYAKLYHFLLKESLDGKNENLKVALRDFRKIDSDLPVGIIMELCKLQNDGLITEEMLGEAILSINAYLIRRSICDMNSQNISKLFPTILKKILERCNGEYSSLVQVLNQEMVGNTAQTSGSYMPNNKQIHEALHYANVYKRPALRIILDRMELDKNPAPVDLTNLSIEHLMPQTPTDAWLQDLDIDYEKYLENVHRLGNLTLASKKDNSKMSNDVWGYKNEVLKNTAHLILNAELFEIKKWNIEQIELRTKRMIEKICELYPYPDVKIVEERDIVDDAAAYSYALERIGAISKLTRVGNAYRSENDVGYVFCSSKMYRQGEKQKYWFGYREKRLEQITDCSKREIVLICRHKEILLVKFPVEFLESHKNDFIKSIDDDGNVRHYHINIFNYQNGKVSMLLSNPTTREIDVSEYVIN